MTYLITGGAGFIGSHFLRLMLEKHAGCHFVCLDVLTYAGNPANIADILNKENFTFVKGDIANIIIVNNVFSIYHPDIIVNFAAESHVDRSIESVSPFIHTNVEGTHVLLDVCLKYGIKRFHQVSTDEVYGSLESLKQIPFCEDSLLSPTNPYAASKASGDMLALSYYKTFGLPVTITRCSNNYGSHQYPEKLIPRMIANAMEGKSLPVYGDGQNIREWIHVKDHCMAIETVLLDGYEGQVYNVGANIRKTNIEVVKMILDLLNKPTSLITYVDDRLGHDKCYSLDTAKIRKTLGWNPKIDFFEGLSETVVWYESNKEWLYNIIRDTYKSKERELLNYGSRL